MHIPEGTERVLVAPLHWGLGHATRCIPVVRWLLDQGKTVIISAQDGPRQILEKHFPEVEFITIPFMPITYLVDGNMVRHFTLRGPRFLRSIWREHRLLSSIVKKHKIDCVISDARFGLWTRKCHSIFITHQISIQSPRLQGLINLLNRWVMNRYDEVWIPDHEEKPGLAGELSHPDRMPKRFKYVGPLSRFEGPLSSSSEKKWDAVVIISGPEPQRRIFEADMARQFIENGERALILQGKPDNEFIQDLDTIQVVHHLEDDAFVEALATTKKVICRSGYSSIMDMHVLGVENVEYHPTPGQTEQEYLARLHSANT